MAKGKVIVEVEVRSIEQAVETTKWLIIQAKYLRERGYAEDYMIRGVDEEEDKTTL